MSKVIYVDEAGSEVPEGSASSAYIVNKDDPHSSDFLKSLQVGKPLQTLVTKPKRVAVEEKSTSETKQSRVKRKVKNG